MAKPTTAAEAVVYNAIGPKKIRVGKEEIEEFTPAEIITAEHHAAAKVAAGKNHFGLRFNSIIPPGAG